MVRAKSCSGCGKKDHLIRECDWVGVTLHGFINTADQAEAMDMITCLTFGGMEELQRRLDVPKPAFRQNRFELLTALRTRWMEIRMALYDMIEEELLHEKRMMEQRMMEQRMMEQRMMEQRMMEQRMMEQRMAEEARMKMLQNLFHV